ncbi:MAG: GlpM family protein [Methanoregula sp.]|nr:GlpM family protein [Methanoregula sp.]
MIVDTMEYLQTLLKFIAGGSIIVGVTYLAQQVNPKYGGILAAAPIITTIAFLFTYNEAGRATTQQLVLGTFFFAIPSVIFLVSLYFLMNRLGFLESLGGAYGVWIMSVLVISRFIPVV